MKATWDPQQYLQFADDRARPFVDLLARMPDGAHTVVDLGCGPGNLTPLLRSAFPDAQIVGVDSSAEMIDRARADDPATEYVLADVATWRPDGPVDAIVSNALFQWLDNRLDVIREITGYVRPGGVFALQVPANGASPSHRLLFEIANREPYAAHTAEVTDRFFVDGPELYLDLFAQQGWTADAWSTTYLHVLPGEDPVFEWVSGTGARPVLQSLPDDLRPQFETEYKAVLRDAFPRQEWGTVLPFTRTFCVAVAP